MRIAVIKRDKEIRCNIWEAEIVEWLNEIYGKCENLEYGYHIADFEHYDALKRAFAKPKVVIDSALMDFCDEDSRENNENKKIARIRQRLNP